MANDYPKSKYNDGRVIDNAISIFDKLIEEHFDPQPYKFEELEDGMWVWDEKEKVCTHIITLFVEQEKRMIVEYKDPYGFWHDSLTFEEGRFFPITKANQ